MTNLDESSYRALIQSTFDRVENAFDDIDPDLAECTQSSGALTLTLSDQSRIILSAQPSVRQLWLALAARGTALHLNWKDGAWMDDKNRGIELYSYLTQILTEAGVAISF